MTASVIVQELDLSLIEGLKLLHSKDSDSIEQLRQQWKQSVREKYGTEREPVSVLHKVSIPSGIKREAGHELNDDLQFEAKKSKLENSPVLFHKSAPASPQGSGNIFNYGGDDVEINVSSSDDDSDYNDSPLEILNGDGVCVKCKNSNSNHNNKLVECVDCHKHYHQQCHFPPITDMDLSDPRFVWYCSSCEQNITTTTTSDKGTKSSSSSGLSSNKSSSSTKSTSSSVSKNVRSYGTSSHTSRSTISSGSSSSSSSGSTKLSAGSSPKHSSSSSIQDKKSQLIKKRTLKKHDKRKSGK